MKPVRLGTKSGGGALSVDVAHLIESRLLLQANSGGGKSWALRRLLEQTHGHVQQLVLDVDDEFHTLRERYDYVLAGRDGGDCPADVETAEALARRLLELRVSAIIGIYELKAKERIRFVARFLSALIEAPRQLWHPVLVVVDEAHIFAPQQGKAESTAAVIDLMTRGRKRGFCGVLATQRISKLHKDAAAEANNKLIGRSALDRDMLRAADELGFGTRADQKRLRALSPGHFYAFGPAISDEVVRCRVGPVSTTHPRPGVSVSSPPSPPSDQVRAALRALSDLPRRALEDARSIDQLQAEVARYQRELAIARAHTVDVAAVDRARVDGHAAGLAQGRAEASELTRHLNVATETIGELARRLASLHDTLSGSRPIMRRPFPRALKAPVNGEMPARPPARIQRAAGDSSTDLTGPEQRILNALAWLGSIGVAESDAPAVAFLAGYKVNCGAFNNPKGKLRSKGLIEYLPGKRMRLTDDGARHAVVPDRPLTDDALHAAVLERLPGPERRLLEPLLAAFPNSLSNAQLATAAGYTAGAGAFNNPRGRLRSLGLVEYPRPKHVRAAALLFVSGE